MKRKNKSCYVVIGIVSLLFTSQTFAMSPSEAAYFKRECIKSGGHVGYRDDDYVCAGGSVRAPARKGSMVKSKNPTQHKKINSHKKTDKEMAY